MLSSEWCAHCCEELSYELGSVVGRKVHWYAVWEEQVVREQILDVRGCHFEMPGLLALAWGSYPQ